ncbi:MAG: radical SAM protein [Pseudomonadota bacterium]
MERYVENQHPTLQYGWNEDGSGVISLMASRGCPYGCLYCDHTVKGYDLRYRSVGHVLDEIRHLKENYGERIRTFYFWDDILIWDREWTVDFCSRLIREKFEVLWTCNCHVHKVDARLMKLMKEAGCVNVRFGIESGSQRMLDTLKKGVKVEKALEALRICMNAGLYLTLYIMVGVPGENQETVEETLSFFERLIGPATVRRIKRVHFFILTPYPGTRLFEAARKKGLINDLEAFLHRGCDAYSDIPLNISGQSDGEILRLKEFLQDRVGRMLQGEHNHLLNILIEMKEGRAVGV